MMLWCGGKKTEQQESRPPRHSLSDWLSLGGLVKAGESYGLGRWGRRTISSKTTGKRARQFIHRKRRAALGDCHPGEALPLMGLDLFFASSSLSSKLSLVRVPFILTSQSTRGSRPSGRGGTRALDPSVQSPCSLLGARVPTWPDPRPRSARPAAASKPTLGVRIGGMRGGQPAFRTSLKTETWFSRWGLLSPATRQEPSHPRTRQSARKAATPGQAGERASASALTCVPLVVKVGRGAASVPRTSGMPCPDLPVGLCQT